MSEAKTKVGGLAEDVTEYIEARWKLFTITAIERVSDTTSSIAVSVILAVVGFFVLFFLSIAAAWWIGQSIENPAIGFASVAGFYVLVGVVLFALREKWIKVSIVNALIRKLYGNHKNNNH